MHTCRDLYIQPQTKSFPFSRLCGQGHQVSENISRVIAPGLLSLVRSIVMMTKSISGYGRDLIYYIRLNQGKMCFGLPSACLYMLLSLRLAGSSAEGENLFVFGSCKFIQHRLVTGHHEQPSSKNGATKSNSAFLENEACDL